MNDANRFCADSADRPGSEPQDPEEGRVECDGSMVRPIPLQGAWLAVGGLSGEAAWQAYWEEASRILDAHSVWEEGRVHGEIVASFTPGGGRYGASFVAREAADGPADPMRYCKPMLSEVGDHGRIECGGLLTLAQPGTLGARPGLAIVCEVNSGSVRARQQLFETFAELDVTGLVFHEAYSHMFTVVKAVFMPEWWVHRGECNAGINWRTWAEQAAPDPEHHFHTAALVWCDELLRRVLHIQENFPVELLYCEWYRACPLVDVDRESANRQLEEFINDSPPTAAAQVAAHLAGRG